MPETDVFEFTLASPIDYVDDFIGLAHQLQHTVSEDLVVPLMTQSTTDIDPPDTVFEVLPELHKVQTMIGDLNELFFDII